MMTEVGVMGTFLIQATAFTLGQKSSFIASETLISWTTGSSPARTSRPMILTQGTIVIAK
jgi:hypothetical protein